MGHLMPQNSWHRSHTVLCSQQSTGTVPVCELARRLWGISQQLGQAPPESRAWPATALPAGLTDQGVLGIRAGEPARGTGREMLHWGPERKVFISINSLKSVSASSLSRAFEATGFVVGGLLAEQKKRSSQHGHTALWMPVRRAGEGTRCLMNTFWTEVVGNSLLSRSDHLWRLHCEF